MSDDELETLFITSLQSGEGASEVFIVKHPGAPAIFFKVVEGREAGQGEWMKQNWQEDDK